MSVTAFAAVAPPVVKRKTRQIAGSSSNAFASKGNGPREPCSGRPW